MTPKPHGAEGKTDGQAMNKTSRISPVPQGLCLHNVVGPRRRAPLSYLGTRRCHPGGDVHGRYGRVSMSGHKILKTQDCIPSIPSKEDTQNWKRRGRAFLAKDIARMKLARDTHRNSGGQWKVLDTGLRSAQRQHLKTLFIVLMLRKKRFLQNEM